MIIVNTVQALQHKVIMGSLLNARVFITRWSDTDNTRITIFYGANVHITSTQSAIFTVASQTQHCNKK